MFPAGSGAKNADSTVVCGPELEVTEPPAGLYCSPEATNRSSWAAPRSAVQELRLQETAPRLPALRTSLHAGATPPSGHCYKYRCVTIWPVCLDKCLEKSLSGFLLSVHDCVSRALDLVGALWRVGVVLSVEAAMAIIKKKKKTERNSSKEKFQPDALVEWTTATGSLCCCYVRLNVMYESSGLDKWTVKSALRVSMRGLTSWDRRARRELCSQFVVQFL